MGDVSTVSVAHTGSFHHLLLPVYRIYSDCNVIKTSCRLSMLLSWFFSVLNLCSNTRPRAMRRKFISQAAKLFKFHLFNKITISHEGNYCSVRSLYLSISSRKYKGISGRSLNYLFLKEICHARDAICKSIAVSVYNQERDVVSILGAFWKCFQTRGPFAGVRSLLSWSLKTSEGHCIT